MDWSMGRGLHCDQGGLGWLFFLWAAHSSSLHPPSLPIKALIFGRMVPHCCLSPSWAPVWLCPPDFPHFAISHLLALALLLPPAFPFPSLFFPGHMASSVPSSWMRMVGSPVASVCQRQEEWVHGQEWGDPACLKPATLSAESALASLGPWIVEQSGEEVRAETRENVCLILCILV